MKSIIIGAIIAIGLYAGGVITGKYYFAKTDIKIVEKEIIKTEWKYKELRQPVFDHDNFNKLLLCYNSELKFKEKTEKNYLHVTAFDECKEAEIRYEIGTKGNWKIYVSIGIGSALIGIIAYNHF
jgi:hypothetical protein